MVFCAGFDVGPQDVAINDGVVGKTLRTFERELALHLDRINLGSRFDNQREIKKPRFDLTDLFGSTQRDAFNAMQVRRGLKQKHQVDNPVEISFALNAPTDFTRAPELSRAHWKPSKIGVVQSRGGDFARENFTGTRRRLVQIGRERALSDFLERVFSLEIIAPFLVDLADLVPKKRGFLIDFLERLLKEGAQAEAQREKPEQSQNHSG